MTTIPLSHIRTDGGTQTRAQLDMATIGEYAEAMKDGAQFPPAIVFYDGSTYWLADGFHRWHAADLAGIATLACDVRPGTRRDAILYSCGANGAHGLRRTNEDKRRAVLLLLNDDEWQRWNDSEIARLCGVSSMFVGNLRRDSAIIKPFNDSRMIERGGTTYTMHTANIGRPAPQPDVDEPLPVFVVAPEPEPVTSPPHVFYNNGNNEWYTPAEYIDAARGVFGSIDLDPASSPEANAVVGATIFYTPDDNGLLHDWRGRVWLNPPYASELIGKFADKLAHHVAAGDVTEAIVLVNNATETVWFSVLTNIAAAVCFPRGRVRFWNPNGDLSQPLQGQAVIYIGPNPGAFRQCFARFGWSASL